MNEWRTTGELTTLYSVDATGAQIPVVQYGWRAAPARLSLWHLSFLDPTAAVPPETAEPFNSAGRPSAGPVSTGTEPAVVR